MIFFSYWLLRYAYEQSEVITHRLHAWYAYCVGAAVIIYDVVLL